MSIRRWAMVAPVLLAAAATPAFAIDAKIFSTEDEAVGACASEGVLYVNLDSGRWYTKSSANYGKAKNGGYGCEKGVKSRYRKGAE